MGSKCIVFIIKWLDLIPERNEWLKVSAGMKQR